MTEEPKAHSTPKLIDICHRPSIRHSNKNYLQSPIATISDYDDEKSQSDSNDDETDDVSQEQLTNTEFCNCLNPITVMAVAILVVLLYALSFNGEKAEIIEVLSFKDLVKKFPSQVEDFWLSVEVNIEEILKFNHPKSFLFLYDDESKKTTDKIVYGISKYAVCTLTNCSSVPVTFEGHELNTPDILNDYGKIIAAVKDKLEVNGVMIVKNLEHVPGKSAQAFHSLCDEYNPVVNKALFIFTMKVNEFGKDNFKLVEKKLLDLWSDIKDDLFHPLFTRISYNILPIMAESRYEV